MQRVHVRTDVVCDTAPGNGRQANSHVASLLWVISKHGSTAAPTACVSIHRPAGGRVWVEQGSRQGRQAGMGKGRPMTSNWMHSESARQDEERGGQGEGGSRRPGAHRGPVLPVVPGEVPDARQAGQDLLPVVRPRQPGSHDGPAQA